MSRFTLDESSIKSGGIKVTFCFFEAVTSCGNLKKDSLKLSPIQVACFSATTAIGAYGKLII